MEVTMFDQIEIPITCPQCGAVKRFTRIIDTENGQYLPDHVGACDRSNSCGYEFTAKQYFEQNRTFD